MRALLFCLVVEAVVTPGPARAANDGWEKLPVERARHIAEFYGKCIVKHIPSLAQDYVAAFADITVLPPKYAPLNDTGCMPLNAQQLVLPGDLLQYSIADALVRQRRFVPPANGFAGVAPLRHPERELADRADRAAMDQRDPAMKSRMLARSARLRQEDFASHIGECVSRDDPVQSFALLTTAVGSDQETSALETLQPAVAACIPKDRTIRFNRVMLRGGIALSYARLYISAATIPTGH